MTNRDDIYRPNSEGITALNICQLLDDKTDAEIEGLMHRGKFEQWLSTTFGQARQSNVPRVISVLSKKPYREFIQAYCSTRYGENQFKWTLMNYLTSQDLDFVSV
jgi:hypothetical protein